MKIYIDVIFAVNLIMDSLVLWSVSVFDRRRVKFKEIIKGASAGSLMYCALFFMPFGGRLINFLYGVLMLMISSAITFKIKSIKTLVRITMLSFIAAVILGGTFISFYYLTNIGYISILSINSISISTLIFLTAFFYFIIKLSGGIFLNLASKRDDYCRIKCFFNNKETEVFALKDTGNFLIDDEEGNKIIISEFSAVRTLFSPTNQILYLQKLTAEEIFKKFCVDGKERIKLIPFSSLGEEKGVLTGIKIDKAEIYDKKTVSMENVLLVIYNGKISQNKSCNGIINPILMER